MSEDRTGSGERDVTVDHETIRRWVEARDGTPAHRTGSADSATSLYVVREDEPTDSEIEEITWERFFDAFEDYDLAFAYSEQTEGDTEEWVYDLVDRQEVADLLAPGDESRSVTPTDDEVGKTVVAAGKTVGMVTEIRGDTMYVDPNPGVTDRLKAALDWGDGGDEARPIDAGQVRRVTDDTVELSADDRS